MLDFNIYLNYSQCNKIWIKKFGEQEYKKRINILNGINVSKALTGKKLSDEHKKKLSESHKGQIAWNKNLTVESDERVRKYTVKRNKTMSKILKQKYASGEMVGWLKNKSKKNNPELINLYKKVSKTMSEKDQCTSRGLAGIRKDIGHFAASTYEANIYRIFQYENKKYKKEHDCIFPLKYPDGSIKNYRIDIQDIEGLFGVRNAYIEVKGFMDERSKLKIKLFREQYPQHILLTVSNGDTREDYYWEPNINYFELEKKYREFILLWEDKKQNIKKTPNLYI